MLNEMQLQQYSEEGYLLLPELVPAHALADLNQRFLDIVSGLHPCSGAMKIMRDVMVVKGAVEPESALHGVNKLFCLEDDDGDRSIWVGLANLFFYFLINCCTVYLYFLFFSLYWQYSLTDPILLLRVNLSF